jgi:hypothetical protein
MSALSGEFQHLLLAAHPNLLHGPPSPDFTPSPYSGSRLLLLAGATPVALGGPPSPGDELEAVRKI